MQSPIPVLFALLTSISANASSHAPAHIIAPARIEHCADGPRYAELELKLTKPPGGAPFVARIERYRLHNPSMQTGPKSVLVLSTRPAEPFGLWSSRVSGYLQQDSAWHESGLELDELRQSARYDVEIRVEFDMGSTSQGRSCVITLSDVQGRTAQDRAL